MRSTWEILRGGLLAAAFLALPGCDDEGGAEPAGQAGGDPPAVVEAVSGKGDTAASVPGFDVAETTCFQNQANPGDTMFVYSGTVPNGRGGEQEALCATFVQGSEPDLTGPVIAPSADLFGEDQDASTSASAAQTRVVFIEGVDGRTGDGLVAYPGMARDGASRIYVNYFDRSERGEAVSEAADRTPLRWGFTEFGQAIGDPGADVGDFGFVTDGTLQSGGTLQRSGDDTSFLYATFTQTTDAGTKLCYSLFDLDGDATRFGPPQELQDLGNDTVTQFVSHDGCLCWCTEGDGSGALYAAVLDANGPGTIHKIAEGECRIDPSNLYGPDHGLDEWVCVYDRTSGSGGTDLVLATFDDTSYANWLIDSFNPSPFDAESYMAADGSHIGCAYLAEGQARYCAWDPESDTLRGPVTLGQDLPGTDCTYAIQLQSRLADGTSPLAGAVQSDPRVVRVCCNRCDPLQDTCALDLSTIHIGESISRIDENVAAVDTGRLADYAWLQVRNVPTGAEEWLEEKWAAETGEDRDLTVDGGQSRIDDGGNGEAVTYFQHPDALVLSQAGETSSVNWARKSGAFGIGQNTTLGGVNGLDIGAYGTIPGPLTVDFSAVDPQRHIVVMALAPRGIQQLQVVVIDLAEDRMSTPLPFASGKSPGVEDAVTWTDDASQSATDFLIDAGFRGDLFVTRPKDELAAELAGPYRVFDGPAHGIHACIAHDITGLRWGTGTAVSWISNENGVNRLHVVVRTDAAVPGREVDAGSRPFDAEPGEPPPPPPPPPAEEGQNIVVDSGAVAVVLGPGGVDPQTGVPLLDGALGVGGSILDVRPSGAGPGLQMQMTAALCGRNLKGTAAGSASSAGGGTVQAAEGIFAYIIVVTGEHTVAAGTRIEGLGSGVGFVLSSSTLDGNGNTILQVNLNSGAWTLGDTVGDPQAPQPWGGILQILQTGANRDDFVHVVESNGTVHELVVVSVSTPFEVIALGAPNVSGVVKLFEAEETALVADFKQHTTDGTGTVTSTGKVRVVGSLVPEGYGIDANGCLTLGGEPVQIKMTTLLDAADPVLETKITTDPPVDGVAPALIVITGEALGPQKAVLCTPGQNVGGGIAAIQSLVGSLAGRQGSLSFWSEAGLIVAQPFRTSQLEGVVIKQMPGEAEVFSVGVGGRNDTASSADDGYVRLGQVTGGTFGHFDGSGVITGVAPGASRVDVLDVGTRIVFDPETGTLVVSTSSAIKFGSVVPDADGSFRVTVPAQAGLPGQQPGATRFEFVAVPSDSGFGTTARANEDVGSLSVAAKGGVFIHLTEEGSGDAVDYGQVTITEGSSAFGPDLGDWGNDQVSGTTAYGLGREIFLPPGEYTLSIRVWGYSSHIESSVEVTASGTTHVDIELSRLDILNLYNRHVTDFFAQSHFSWNGAAAPEIMAAVYQAFGVHHVLFNDRGYIADLDHTTQGTGGPEIRGGAVTISRLGSHGELLNSGLLAAFPIAADPMKRNNGYPETGDLYSPDVLALLKGPGNGDPFVALVDPRERTGVFREPRGDFPLGYPQPLSDAAIEDLAGQPFDAIILARGEALPVVRDVARMNQGGLVVPLIGGSGARDIAEVGRALTVTPEVADVEGLLALLDPGFEADGTPKAGRPEDALNAIVVNGVFVELEVDIDQDGTVDGGVGDFLTDTDGKFDLHVAVVADPALPATGALLFVGTEETDISFDLAFWDPFGTPPPAERLKKVYSFDLSANPTDRACMLYADGRFLTSTPIATWGVTNAIFLDLDGNGRFNP